MSPFRMWATMAFSGGLYQFTKAIIGLAPNWFDYLTAIYWFGAAMIFVHARWVK